MKPALWILLPAAALCAAQADDLSNLPSRRPGLWVTTVDMNRTPIQSQTCIDQATDHALLQAGNAGLEKMGGHVTTTVNGNQVVFHITAMIRGQPWTMDATYNFVNDMQVQGTRTMTIAGRQAPAQTTEAHWSGPCPAGMSPGDTTIAGRTFNVLKQEQQEAAGPPPNQ